MKRIVLAAFLLFASFGLAQAAEEKEVAFGILTWNGPFKGLLQWAATGNYLAEQIGRPVEIKPLDFNEVLPAVEAGRVASSLPILRCLRLLRRDTGPRHC